MLPMYNPRTSSEFEAQLSGLLFVLARDEAHFDGLNKRFLTPDIDNARL